MKIQTVCQFLDLFAPNALAEDWDNTGLTLGDRRGDVSKVMTCLTVTKESADEAIDQQAELIVTHHPLPFRPIKKLTTDAVPTELVWKLAKAGISIYSPHTRFDSAVAGINAMLMKKFGIQNPQPLVACEDVALTSSDDGVGAGRWGTLNPATTLADVVMVAKEQLGIDGLHVVGELDQKLTKLATACGSGGSFLDRAKRVGCDVMVTGEATFHTCLDAKAKGIALVLLGHYASERFAVESLATTLQAEFPDLFVWASQSESDPLQWV